jgi:hypothetical protein
LSLNTVTGIKTYRLTANIRANSAPSPNVARTELFTATGASASLFVQDNNTSAASVDSRDLGVPSGTNLVTFKFKSGDNSGT